ncbi:MAG TPA: TetR family transcriptional regulator [Pseudonocardiaceae bacterium]|nr:TetR family transcriptional regulator [Pseudonocardiaceae bacterium]
MAGSAGDNRRAKQDQIIEAAKHVLARDGLAACTARSVADASPLTKSAIHYYFNDINEIIDRAVAGHIDAMLGALRKVVDDADEPRERLWRVVHIYLTEFVDQPHAAFLWFEYWISAGRRASLTAAEQQLDQVRAFLVDLMTGLPLADPDETAHAVLSWLLGTIVQQHVSPRTLEQLRGELDRVLGV